MSVLFFFYRKKRDNKNKRETIRITKAQIKKLILFYLSVEIYNCFLCGQVRFSVPYMEVFREVCLCTKSISFHSLFFDFIS